MKIYIAFNTDGYAEQFSSTPMVGHVPMELPDNHPYFSGNWSAYRRVGNDLVFDQRRADYLAAQKAEQQKNTPDMAKQLSEIQEILQKLVGDSPEKQTAMVQQIHAALTVTAQGVSEEKAAEMPDLFPQWLPGQAYTVGQRVRYNEPGKEKPTIYQILQAHTSGKQWQPDITPAIYKKISFAAGGVPNWVQPVGSVDAYKINDVVVHKGQQWKSTANANVWEPGVYGWTAIGAAK